MTVYLELLRHGETELGGGLRGLLGRGLGVQDVALQLRDGGLVACRGGVLAPTTAGPRADALGV